jgi:CRISPR/Cas system-associated exonuclease Cas4 (RecB family)
MGNFKHEKIDLGYDDLTAETLPSGRTYAAPNGCNYPSITTVLSILSREAIQAWRARVGPEEANKISRVASGRGTAVHDLLERYVNNDPDFAKGVMPHVMQSFHDVKEQLDTRLTTVYSQEAPLYSEHLGLAGRVDCVGVWDGKNSIVDYKTSRKLKKKEWISGYFMQCAAYAIMWEERTGMPITQLVILIAVDDEKPQVFIEHRDNWVKPLLDVIEQYTTEQKRKQIFGN